MSENDVTNEPEGTPGFSTLYEFETATPVTITYQDKLRLLKSIVLLSNMSERMIQGLAKFIKTRNVPDGDIIFEEGSRGMSMYFVASGRIRIYKETASHSIRELAILGPGDFFGEMALVDEVPRSASAVAIGACLLFELYRGDLTRWVKNSAPQALQFFSELSNVLARRLRKTSRELTLHLDLSDLLGAHRKEAPDFLRDALERVLSHLQGSWSAAGCLASGSSTPIVAASSNNRHRLNDATVPVPGPMDSIGSWVDDETFAMGLNRNRVMLGSVAFRSLVPLTSGERDDLARTLTSACNPITTGLEIIALRPPLE
jgi:CRP-like cAMP-binding protein